MSTSLGLRGQTAASLQSFKKRNDDARRKVQVLSEQPQAVDFSHYRKVLKNQAIVDELENHFKNFKPASYDVSRQLKAIDAFEAQAVQNAEQTKGKIDSELVNLQKTLENIETARPFEDLTVVRIPLVLDRDGVAVGAGAGASTYICTCAFAALHSPAKHHHHHHHHSPRHLHSANHFPSLLGRGCRRPARDRREDFLPCLQGQVDAPRLQGMWYPNALETMPKS